MGGNEHDGGSDVGDVHGNPEGGGGYDSCIKNAEHPYLTKKNNKNQAFSAAATSKKMILFFLSFVYVYA